MAFLYTVTEQINASGVAREFSQSVSNSAEQKFDENVSTGEIDLEIACELDVSELKALLLVSDADVTFETNAGAAPADTIALLADVPYIWHENSYHTLLLTVDVTSVFITNASGSTARVQMFALYDSTP